MAGTSQAQQSTYQAPPYPPTDRLGLGVRVLGLSAEESRAVRDALINRKSDPFQQGVMQHVLDGYLTRQDVMMLNSVLMTDPDPVAQRLLERMRAAVTADSKNPAK